MNNEEKQRICTLMRACLKDNFKQYEDVHEIDATELGDRRVWVGYSPLGFDIDGSQFLRFDLNLNHEKDICYLAHIHIDQKFRRQGIGRQLITSIEDFCRKEKISEIRADYSGESIKFYSAIGFKRESDTSSCFIKEVL